jgi:hypothetical protein
MFALGLESDAGSWDIDIAMPMPHMPVKCDNDSCWEWEQELLADLNLAFDETEDPVVVDVEAQDFRAIIQQQENHR